MIRWTVYFADLRGVTHPYFTLSEEAAKRHTETLFSMLVIPMIEHQIQVWSMFGPQQDDAHAQFVKDAKRLVKKLRADLKNEDAWAAYSKFRDFEEAYGDEFAPMDITDSVGGILVEPDPREL